MADLMDQRERVAAIFDRAAESYDRVGVDMFQPIAARLVEELQPKVGERVVDMGCGRGAALFPLAAAVGPTGHATGLDLAPRMVAAAAAEAAQAGVAVEVVVGDAQEPDLPEQSFDALASSLVLFFLPDPEAALRAWRMLLVDGARIAVSTFGSYGTAWEAVDAVFGPYLPPGMRDARTSGKSGPFASDAGVERLLSDAGFADVRTVRDSVPVRFDDADHWHRWTMSTGQRFMWELVPEGERAAVRARGSASAEDTRQYNADGRIGFDQQVRYTLGRR
jgi:SAM-dependent methyltransferase